jgi:hypothetical protein
MVSIPLLQAGTPEKVREHKKGCVKYSKKRRFYNGRRVSHVLQ